MDMNGGELSKKSKRKHLGSPPQNPRPAKHMRDDMAVGANEEDVYSEDLEDDEFMADELAVVPTENATRILPAITATHDSAEWQRTIESVVRNVVSIRFCQTCSFDTDPAVTSEATGFVVDAEKGYILTNRHVVGAGPFWGFCVFDNHEEVRWVCKWTTRWGWLTGEIVRRTSGVP